MSPEVAKGLPGGKVTLHVLTPLSFVVAGVFSHLVKSYMFFWSLLSAPNQAVPVFLALNWEHPEGKDHL